MKVILAPEGSRGDVQPMIALGQGLVERGHDVLLAGPETFRALAGAHGVPFAAAGPDIEPIIRQSAGNVWHLTRYLLREAIPTHFDTLPGLCDGADLVVGAGAQFVARSVAQRHEIPYAYVAYVPIVIPSAYHPPAFVHTQRWPHWMNRLLWSVFAAVSAKVFAKVMTAGRARLGLPPIDDLVAHLYDIPAIAALEPELAPLPPDVPANVHVTGPLPLASHEPLAAEVLRFLEDGPPPVLVGFGSMVSGRPREIVRLFADAAQEVGCRLLVQVGWTGLREADIQLPDGCKLIGAAPHRALLPRVRAVVHHGGSGTTTSVAAAGVPQCILPHLLDQYYWAHRVRTLGLGPPAVSVHRVHRKRRVASLLADLIETPSYATRARDLAARLGHSDGIDLTVEVLEGLVG